ncbi:hypothetical protein Patl_0503 [Paraglaciecola sp. T6c]|uniref:hypothetical protein n=1 Tax=Pseudoalteromonas atlantica (strain T6c / ATCC BAA-1087) TaxID=3042615 RepID=UPI00005C6903|nr:hypothetical protein [Paraglaciecola sp. T6c]ABG39032.1 hypothetical protein Patl_0503 [Paraglaciecola sp. T6c]
MNNIKMAVFTRMLISSMLAFGISTTAIAQESSYSYGTVWEAHGIRILPGQFENYMDHLAGSWKDVYEFAKKEGHVVDYHVLANNHAREGEPDLILVVEYKDYIKTAEYEAFQKKVDEMMSTNERKADKEFGERETMRKTLSSSQYQELDLK